MSEVESLLQRQAQWQLTRAARSWSEKIREAEQLRTGILALRRTVWHKPLPGPKTDPPAMPKR